MSRRDSGGVSYGLSHLIKLSAFQRHAEYQSIIWTLRIWPPGGPKPKLEMYSEPSGPKARPVGKKRGSLGVLSIRTCCWPLGSMRIRRPVAGTGPGELVEYEVSSTYRRARLSKVRPSTLLNPVVTTLSWPAPHCRRGRARAFGGAQVLPCDFMKASSWYLWSR